MSGMKTRTIRSALSSKVKEIAESIIDIDVKLAFERDAIVAGGAIASMLAGEKVNDYDIYFRSKETAKMVAEYYVDLFKERHPEKSQHMEVREVDIVNLKGVTESRIKVWIQSSGALGDQKEEEEEAILGEVEFIESLREQLKEKYHPVFITDNAISLSNKVQLVIRFFGEPEEIYLNYDYAHCMSSYDYSINKLDVKYETLLSILTKELKYRGSLYPIASLFRIRKFIERGWRITAGEMLKIIWQLKEIDFNDQEMLREQLIGVDQAYMGALLAELEKMKGKRIDDLYLTQLIDKVFE